MKPYPSYKPEDRLPGIDRIPAHWKVVRNSLVFTEVNETGYSKLELLSITADRGIIKQSDTGRKERASEDRSTYKRILKGDIGYNLMNAFIGAIGMSNYDGIISPAYAVCRPRIAVDSNYFHYLFRTGFYLTQFDRYAYGIMDERNRLYFDNFKKIYVPFPPLDEQRLIVRFINRKLAQIDQFICYKRHLIELLDEQKKALINRAVTKGVDRNTPMKPSGVEWLGDIPSHWEVRKVKYLAKILRGKFTHRPRNDPRLYNGSYPFIQTGDVANSGKYVSKYSQTLNEEGLAVSKLFSKGTLVMTIAANIADVAILQFDACFPDSIVGFIPESFIQVDYLYNLLLAMRQEFLSIAPENTQLNLNVERVGSSVAAFPPSAQEQTEILNYIETESSKISEVIAQAEKEIELIQEYRTVLISDAIMGKIDVRDTIEMEVPIAAGGD